MSNYEESYNAYKSELEHSINAIFKNHLSSVPPSLREAMEYSLISGGKRIRGVLLLATAKMLGVEPKVAVAYGDAVEMMHAASLIHDDLPCMDNDTMRRGKPCNHVVFGEAKALYAGVGLWNLAYEVLLAKANRKSDIDAIFCLANAAGVTGIVKGQCLDIEYEGKEIDFETLRSIHKAKTGALIKASVVIPAIVSDADKVTYDALSEFGDRIGVAFQIIDDVLDVTSSSCELGKTAGKDLEADKLTYVKMFGVDEAKKMAEQEINKAILCLNSINYDSGFLQDTAKLILNRRN